jgi:chorismate mutase
MGTETRPQACRGVRGATTTPVDSAEAIHAATRELLLQIGGERHRPG